MPNYEVHRKIGFIVSLIIGIIIYILLPFKIQLNYLEWFLLALTILFYSNLPDLDHHLSKLRKKLFSIIFTIMILSGLIVFFVNIWAGLLVLTLIGIGGLLLLKVRHRGPLHTYWFVLFAALPLFYIHWLLFVLGLSCAVFHIFIDRIFSRTKIKIKKTFGIREDHTLIVKF